MKAYLRTTLVKAKPLMGPPNDEGAQEAGYRVVYPDGYVSWCPKEEFERVTREVSRAEAALIEESSGA